MKFIPPARLFREKRATRRAEREAAAASLRNAEQAETLKNALQSISATVSGVKVPNGTTKKIGRIADEALLAVA